MGYRSIKRVLGETSLERKCRILFGVAITVLIAAAFSWVEFNAEKIVMENARLKGRDLVSLKLMAIHFQAWYTDPSKEPNRNLDALKTTISSLDQKAYEFEVLEYDPFTHHRIKSDRSNPKALEAWELAALDAFGTELAALEIEKLKGTEPPPDAPLATEPVDEETEIIFRDRILADSGEYHYLQAVMFEEDCKGCHLRTSASGVTSAGDLDSFHQPVTAIRVVLPYERTRTAIASARAGLIAAAILTVFVSMIALYVIVRYVIVKPLKHLRDVSDEISRGEVDVRAELKTGDEFEELASSFNRMLRHLTDTQANLREANEELDGKIDLLAQANMRLYEMNRLKGDFLANMSHELRTPLNSIIGFSEVLQGLDSLDDRQKRYAKNIKKSGRLLLEMINDILDLAKMEAGKMEVRPTEFRIDALVHSQCDLLRSFTDEKNIDLRIETENHFQHAIVDDSAEPQHEFLVFQDQGKVQQILTNLLSNAIKFTPEGGIITVLAAHTRDDMLRLQVSDTGVGIAQEDREIIFEKFRQGNTVQGEDNLKREYSGTGLGLSIVKELCILLGGEVSVESEIGKGSSFDVLLPWNCPTATANRQSIDAQVNDLMIGQAGSPTNAPSAATDKAVRIGSSQEKPFEPSSTQADVPG